MFSDFLTVFHMVWKNQESGESWLIGFWASRCSKLPKILVNTFFPFLSFPHGFSNYFETLNFVFLILYLQEFQPAKY